MSTPTSPQSPDVPEARAQGAPGSGSPGAGAAAPGTVEPCAATPQLAAAMAARAKMERLLAAPSPFAGDEGDPDPAVTAALEDLAAPRHEYLDRLWAALSASRLIVPVAAHALHPRGPGRPGPRSLQLGGSAPTHEAHTADACQDAAALAVDLPDGHRALPVFTSARALAAWSHEVRPVPVEPRRAAQVACLSTDQLWVLDPGSRDLRLPRPAVVALAGGQDWVPSWRNRPVQAEIRAQIEAAPGVTGVAFAPGEEAELRVLIRIDASGGRTAVAATLEQCQHVMVNPAWGELIDTVELCPLPA